LRRAEVFFRTPCKSTLDNVIVGQEKCVKSRVIMEFLMERAKHCLRNNEIRFTKELNCIEQKKTLNHKTHSNSHTSK
jgi:hypothetical protein